MSDIFDQKRIRKLIELMKENDLSELDIQQGDLKVQLKRSVALPMQNAYTPVSERALPPANPLPLPADTAVYIKSPMVGTFYAAANPDAAPFVKVGSKVNLETTVCIIEAMKVYNEIQAELTGTIAEILVANGTVVEFGQNLFRLDI